MRTTIDTDIVLPHAAPAVAGYTRAEFDVLIASGLVEEEGLIHGAGCGAHYKRSELLAFRDRVSAESTLAATIDELLGREPTSRNADVVLPYAACRVLGYTQREMTILTECGVIAHLIHPVRSGHFYLRPELLAFRARVRTEAALAARIEYFITKDCEN